MENTHKSVGMSFRLAIERKNQRNGFIALCHGLCLSAQIPVSMLLKETIKMMKEKTQFFFYSGYIDPDSGKKTNSLSFSWRKANNTQDIRSKKRYRRLAG